MGYSLLASSAAVPRFRRNVVIGAAILGAGVVVWNSTLGRRTPEPAHAVELADGDFELRRYAPRAVAETRVTTGDADAAANEGFRRLAGYIFGGNRARERVAMTAPVGQRATSERIAMTAPVGQRAEGGAWVVRFTMPAGRALASLPAPNDPRVVLGEVPEERFAVVRFSGFWTGARVREHEAALRRWLEARGLRARGEAEYNRYDPPWTLPFLRRHEVWLRVDEG